MAEAGSAVAGRPPRRPRRRLATAAIAAGVAAALCLLQLLPAWSLVEARLYDVVSTVAPARPAAPGAIIVAIDEPSFAELGLQWPWPREVHARLVAALRAAGAKVIGLDVIFAEASNQASDGALAAAMGPDVVLAAEETVVETPQAVQTILVEPFAALTAAGASAGIASVALDGDGTLRRMPPYPDGFAARLLAAAGAPVPATPPGTLMQFFGPPRSYPTVSYYQALEPEKFLPPGTFAGKTVIVGFGLQHAAEVGGIGTDSFETPFTPLSGQLTAGAEIQATMLDNLAGRLFVRPLPWWTTTAAIIVVALLAAFLVRRDATWRTMIAAGLGVLAIVAGSWALLRFGRVWAPPALPALALAFVTAGRGALDFAEERRLRRSIARAFGHYLAPELVERLAADPASLKLGGERRTLSVLFCDVRGFTTLAERLKDEPERLTALVNRLLDPLSEAVLAERGTIDKFIGDCVMAFWNAPLDEPRHAERAVAAGLAMLEAIAALNVVLAAEMGAAAPAIAVGIGINTGDCVVGNMGSRRRFDYTALGDAVNLASRLEGLSKRCRVPILIGETTAAAIADEFVTLELDRVAVKGRGTTTAVFTVLGPAAMRPEAAPLVAAHGRFLAAYRARRWHEAEVEAASAAAMAPGLAGYYAAAAGWIADHRASPLGEGWAGEYVAVEK